jgi:hypothetical protein
MKLAKRQITLPPPESTAGTAGLETDDMRGRAGGGVSIPGQYRQPAE